MNYDYCMKSQFKFISSSLNELIEVSKWTTNANIETNYTPIRTFWCWSSGTDYDFSSFNDSLANYHVKPLICNKPTTQDELPTSDGGNVWQLEKSLSCVQILTLSVRKSIELDLFFQPSQDK